MSGSPAVVRRLTLPTGETGSVPRGFVFEFEGDHVKLKKQGEVIAVGKKQSNLIYRIFLDVEKLDRHELNVCMSSIEVWHKRLAHSNVRVLRGLVFVDLIPGVKFEKDEFFCEPCQLSAQAAV